MNTMRGCELRFHTNHQHHFPFRIVGIVNPIGLWMQSFGVVLWIGIIVLVSGERDDGACLLSEVSEICALMRGASHPP